MAPARRITLQQGLDQDIYQVVRKYLDEKNELASQLQVTTIFDHISRSNSSLKRRPKKQLEDSIERAIDVIQDDERGDSQDETVDLDGDFSVPDTQKAGKDKSGDWMNRQIVKQWSNNSGRSNPAANGEKVDKSKKRRMETYEKEREGKRQRQSDASNTRTIPRINTRAPTGIRLADLGGFSDVKKQLMEHLVMPLLSPEEYVNHKIPIPRGILLHGPPGCGKTVISRAFAAELGVPFIQILGPSIVSGISGESEENIREHFQKAKKSAPCLIFIDEIDVIAPKREHSQSQMEKRIVAQLLLSMDSLAMEENNDKPVIVLAATNRPDSLDPALRRGGRFDTEINMGVPNESTRERILKALTRGPALSEDVDFPTIAKKTAGFVGSDLKDLVSKAGTWSMSRYREALQQQAAGLDMESDDGGSDIDQAVTRLIQRVRMKDFPRPQGFEISTITMAAFDAVLPTITPSSKREGFATVPDTTWSDVGALANVREELEMAICEPIKDPEKFIKFGVPLATGILLWGPPGCGKTLLAKAVAAESKANFISIKGPELLNKVCPHSLVRHMSYKIHASFSAC